jgi:sugar diacid utilization regulator
MQDIVYGVPVEYISQTLESLLYGCVSLEYQYTIVSYVRFLDYPNAFAESLQVLERFLSNSEFRVGASNVFDDFLCARYYYQQACCAIETGKELDPNRKIYNFSDFALTYMIKNRAGGLPVEYVCHPGLLRLKKESTSDVNYWETLQVYIQNGMNAVQTAKDMYLHRSTVQYRLSKISKILEADLNDTRQLQYLIYSMNLMELRDGLGR